MLEIKNLKKVYKDFKIENFNLTINNGEIMSILGESGSGKSTILRIASALDEECSGEITLNGKQINSSLKDGEVAVVFQDSLLLNHLNLIDNIKFGMKFRKISKSEMEERANEIIELLELNGMEKKFPNELSGGQKQRVAIARALVMKPKFLLMDEPFSALDGPLRERLQQTIKEIQRKKKLTILFITHDRDEAFTISDRIGIMKSGELMQVGTPKEIYDNPNSVFVANFLGIENTFSKDEIPDFLKSCQDLKLNELNKLNGKFKNVFSGKIVIAIKNEDFRVSANEVIGENSGVFKGEVLDSSFKSGFYEIVVKCFNNKKIKIKQNRLNFNFEIGDYVLVKYRMQDLVLIDG